MTELLVVMAVVLVLTSLMGVAVSASQNGAKIRRTRALIAKLNEIIGAQYMLYESRDVKVAPSAVQGYGFYPVSFDPSDNASPSVCRVLQAVPDRWDDFEKSADGWKLVGNATGRDEDEQQMTRADILRTVVSHDLPDSWAQVNQIANDALDSRKRSLMSPHQLAYVSVWDSIAKQGKTDQVSQHNGSAECLFMIVMQGGISDCLDCHVSRLDVGDQDRDTMPEFLDAWGRPIGFVLWPSKLRIPAGAKTNFFSTKEPFDSVMPSPSEAPGGLMRPLIFSAGPDGEAGLAGLDLIDEIPPVSGPLDASQYRAAFDNVTNFDEAFL